MEQIIKVRYLKVLYLNTIILILLLVFPLILPFNAHVTAHAEENCEWKEVRGEALADTMTIEDAGKLARRRAQLSAAEEVAGVQIYGGTTLVNSKLVADLAMTLTKGYIMKEEIVKWEAEFQQSSPDTPPIPLYRVYTRCCISKDKEERDPFFTLSIETNKPVFFSGEEAKLKIKANLKANQKAYITIFHLSSEEKLRILLPDQFQKEPYITEGKEFTFPAQGLGLRVTTTADHKREVEYFMVVATKEWFDFEGQFKKNKDIPISSFYSVLLSIPAKARAIAIGGYEVIEKDGREE